MEEEKKIKYRKTFRIMKKNKVLQQCLRCREWKPLTEFHRENRFIINPENKLKIEKGYTCVCKNCRSEYFKKWYAENREYRLKQMEAYNKKKKGLSSDFVLRSEMKNNLELAFDKHKNEVLKKAKKEYFDKIAKNKSKKIDLLKTWTL